MRVRLIFCVRVRRHVNGCRGRNGEGGAAEKGRPQRNEKGPSEVRTPRLGGSGLKKRDVKVSPNHLPRPSCHVVLRFWPGSRNTQEMAAQTSAALGGGGSAFLFFFRPCGSGPAACKSGSLRHADVSRTLHFVLQFDMSAKRSSYSLKFKRAAIAFAEANGNHSAAAEFGVDRACIIRWRKQRDQIFKGAVTRKKFTGPRKGRHPQLEEEVCEFVRSERCSGFAVTADAIQVKAMEIASRMQIPRAVFRASRGWVERTMRRNGFSLRRRTTICQKLPGDFDDKLIAFQKYVLGLRRENDYGLGQIGNADETPVFFDMPRAYTVNEVGAREVKVRTTGYEKQRVTVMLCITADGRKLPPYIILKRKNMPKNEPFPSDVIVRAQEKGWMTAELMSDWIRVVWQRRPGAMLGGPSGTRSMLVLDAFRGHLTPEVKTRLQNSNCDLVVIPGGMTPVLQPLDVSVNKPFKAYLRQQYEEWVRNPDRKKTPTGKLQKASPATIATWISDAWKRIEVDTIAKSFKKCSISNNMDGTEDDMLWDTESGTESGGSTTDSGESDGESE